MRINFAKFIKKYAAAKNHICRLEEVDNHSRTVIICYYGIPSSVVLRIDEVVSDIALLANLSPFHASVIGYHYGIYYTEEMRKMSASSSYPKVENFVFSGSQQQCKLIMQDRGGRIIYFDKSKDQYYANSPSYILGKPSLIGKFNSVEACYIGMLCGISVVRNVINNSSLDAMPSSRLIK